MTLGLVALAAAVARCRASEAPIVACVDPTLLNVGTGTAPQFGWTPTCLAYEVIVTDSVGNFMWGIKADSGNVMMPSVTYGVTPTGGYTVLYPTVPLQSGKSYAVGLYVFVGPLPSQTDLLNAKAFRP